MQRNCFCCRQELKPILTNHDGTPIEYGMHNGVIFESEGTYGSEVFDGQEKRARLEMYICDECLKDRGKLVYTFNVQNKRTNFRKFRNV